MDKKTNDNNRHTHKNTHKFGQVDLSGNLIRNFPKLRGHYKNLLETFYVNPSIAITQTTLFDVWGKGVHFNSINNFIRDALQRGWITKLDVIKGAVINSPFFFQKMPDKLQTGQVVYDRRLKYYLITDEGKRIFELNEAFKT
jgi:hypothetical protein